MKSERDGAEFTQQDLADKAGVSQGNIAHLESGRTKTSRNLVAIAEAVDAQPRWLAEGKGIPYVEGSKAYLWLIQRTARPGFVSIQTEQADPKPPVPPSEPTRSLIWVDSYDLELLTLAHRTDADGRDKILRAAKRMPIVVVDAVRNKS